MILKCDSCPRCKDVYPGKLDSFGNHFNICGMSGNMVYTEPRKERRYSGKGYIKYGVSSCGLYQDVEDALSHMTESERIAYFKNQELKKEWKHDKQI